MKLKINDKIKIVGNSNWHSYNIWEECYIVTVYEDYYDTSKIKWWIPRYSGQIIEDDCELIAKGTITPWIMVWVSNESQEDADSYYRVGLTQYYIWRNKDWDYITEDDDWNLISWKYISTNKEGRIP